MNSLDEYRRKYKPKQSKSINAAKREHSQQRQAMLKEKKERKDGGKFKGREGQNKSPSRKFKQGGKPGGGNKHGGGHKRRLSTSEGSRAKKKPRTKD